MSHSDVSLSTADNFVPIQPLTCQPPLAKESRYFFKPGLRFFRVKPSPRQCRLQKLKTVLAIHLRTNSLHRPDRSLKVQDRGSTPYRFEAARRRLLTQSHLTRPTKRSPSESQDDLRSTLTEYFQRREASFDFWVELQAKLLERSGEDPTFGWQDQTTPHYQVTVLQIPHQTGELEALQQLNKCWSGK